MFNQQEHRFMTRRRLQNPISSSQSPFHDEDQEIPLSESQGESAEQFYKQYSYRTSGTYSFTVIAFAALLLATIGAIEGTTILSFNYIKATFVFSSCLLLAGIMYGNLLKNPPLSSFSSPSSTEKKQQQQQQQTSRSYDRATNSNERATNDGPDGDNKRRYDPVKDFIFNGKSADQREGRAAGRRRGNSRLVRIFGLVRKHLGILRENASFIAVTTLCGLGATVAYFALVCRVSNPSLKASEKINGEGPWSIFIAEVGYKSKKTVRFLSSDSYAVVVAGLMLGFLTAIRKIYSGDYYLYYSNTFVNINNVFYIIYI